MTNWASTTTSVVVGNIYMVIFRNVQCLYQFGVRTSFVFFNSSVCCPVRFREHLPMTFELANWILAFGGKFYG